MSPDVARNLLDSFWTFFSIFMEHNEFLCLIYLIPSWVLNISIDSILSSEKLFILYLCSIGWSAVGVWVEVPRGGVASPCRQLGVDRGRRPARGEDVDHYFNDEQWGKNADFLWFEE